MSRSKDAGARAAWWLAIGGGVLSGGWLWPYRRMRQSRQDRCQYGLGIGVVGSGFDDDGAGSGAVLRWPGAA